MPAGFAKGASLPPRRFLAALVLQKTETEGASGAIKEGPPGTRSPGYAQVCCAALPGSSLAPLLPQLSTAGFVEMVIVELRVSVFLLTSMFLLSSSVRLHCPSPADGNCLAGMMLVCSWTMRCTWCRSMRVSVSWVMRKGHLMRWRRPPRRHLMLYVCAGSGYDVRESAQSGCRGHDCDAPQPVTAAEPCSSRHWCAPCRCAQEKCVAPPPCVAAPACSRAAAKQTLEGIS
jgi:hypothetical protein